MKKLGVSLIVTILLSAALFAQDSEEKPEFKPSGKPYANIFSNFNVISYDGNTDYGFDITRAYLGYSYNFSEHFSGKVNIDVGAPEVYINDSVDGSTNLDLTAYLKIASLTYKYDKLTVDFGMIGLKQFKVAEGFWGHRYIYKSFQDASKMGYSADLGMSVAYDIIDQLSVDFTVTNGEGYKSLQADSLLKYAAGITGKPVEGLVLRVYYDMMGEKDMQSTFSAFAGYADDKISIGAEYDFQMNNKVEKGKDLSGISAYASYQLTDMIEVFGRYDNLSSVKLDGADDPWNIKKDGQAIIGGAEFNLAKGVKIAPNYQGWISSRNGEKAKSGFFINLDLKF
ncbi:MAG: hypothetical protein JXB49_18880 [Bacteroidales bacterium]|nr:hypothetical protein [Bacteroidales bacterium]